MKIIGIAGGLFLLSAVSQANAALAIMGFGSHTCTRYESDIQSQPQMTQTLYFTWAQGFMSALNYDLLMQGQKTRDLITTPVASQEQFIQTYCSRQASSDFSDAVLALFATFNEVTPSGSPK